LAGTGGNGTAFIREVAIPGGLKLASASFILAS